MTRLSASLKTSLFVGQRVRFTAIDYDRDPAVEAAWSEDASLARDLGPIPLRPISTAQMVKRYEALEKEIQEDEKRFRFQVRPLEDPRLVGVAELYNLDWQHGAARLQVWVGAPADRRQGYGREMLHLLLRFAFHEINLHRVEALLPAYNAAGRGLAARAGFQLEVTRRAAIQRDGRPWDLLHYGLLAREWPASLELA